MAPVGLHILTAHSCRMEGSENVVVHRTADLEARLIRICDDVYAVAPEPLVQQLASSGSLSDLTQLVFELCGTYRHPTNERVFLPDRKSFTSVAKLQAHLELKRPFKGAVRFENALKFACDGSGSHMETACAILLGFPYRYGGLGFPPCRMNYELVVPKKLIKHAGRQR